MRFAKNDKFRSSATIKKESATRKANTETNVNNDEINYFARSAILNPPGELSAAQGGARIEREDFSIFASSFSVAQWKGLEKSPFERENLSPAAGKKKFFLSSRFSDCVFHFIRTARAVVVVVRVERRKERNNV